MSMPQLFYFSVIRNILSAIPTAVLDIFQPGAYILATHNRFSCELCELWPWLIMARDSPGLRVANFTCIAVGTNGAEHNTDVDLRIKTVQISDWGACEPARLQVTSSLQSNANPPWNCYSLNFNVLLVITLVRSLACFAEM